MPATGGLDWGQQGRPVVWLRPEAGVVTEGPRADSHLISFRLSLASRHIPFHFFFPLHLSQRVETFIFTVMDKVKLEREALVSVSECEYECECFPV